MTVLSQDQDKALDQMITWIEGLRVKVVHCNGATDCANVPHTHGFGLAPVFSLGGWAGSGKTTIMRVLDESVDGEIVFGTPTHKAAEVLRRKLAPAQAARVRTVHSLTYQMTPIYHCTVTGKLVYTKSVGCVCKRGEEDGCQCPMSFLPCGTGAAHQCKVASELKSERRQYLYGHRDLIVIDESSMLSKRMVEDIRRFGVPIILVGDNGQLPPIRDAMNPWTLGPDVQLTEIHRQGADSGILQAAHDVRTNGFMSRYSYGVRGDAYRMLRSTTEFIELMDRFTPGPGGALITHTNRLRSRINHIYHTKLVGTPGPGPGDQVVALGGQPYEAARVVMDGGVPRATGEFLMVHNGMTGTVLKASERGVVTELTVQLDGHRLSTPENPVVILTGGAPTAQFGAEAELEFNSPLRPKGSHMWDYAYALTAHKAQGSEWRHVIVVDTQPPEYRRWMYTALTRAQEAVIVVDWAR